MKNYNENFGDRKNNVSHWPMMIRMKEPNQDNKGLAQSFNKC